MDSHSQGRMKGHCDLVVFFVEGGVGGKPDGKGVIWVVGGCKCFKVALNSDEMGDLFVNYEAVEDMQQHLEIMALVGCIIMLS